nr:MAG TPA: hypothetical protein [Caudoviricetes sp.]
MCSSSLVILVCSTPRLTKVRWGVMLCLGDGRLDNRSFVSPLPDRPSPQKRTDLNRPAQSLNNAGHHPRATVGSRRTQPETIVVEAESGPQHRRPTPSTTKGSHVSSDNRTEARIR